MKNLTIVHRTTFARLPAISSTTVLNTVSEPSFVVITVTLNVVSTWVG